MSHGECVNIAPGGILEKRAEARTFPRHGKALCAFFPSVRGHPKPRGMPSVGRKPKGMPGCVCVRRQEDLRASDDYGRMVLFVPPPSDPHAQRQHDPFIAHCLR